MKIAFFLLLHGFLILHLFGCGNDSRQMHIIAHRGESFLAPENTVASAKLAWEQGADGVEVDVYLSKDDRIVVLHDSSTKRTTGTDLSVRETPSEELRKLDAGSFKSADFTGEKIPFLEEIIETVPPGGLLFVEIKCGEEILPILQPVIESSQKKSQIVIIGFDLQVMAAAKKRISDVPVYWLVGTDKDPQSQQWIPHNTELIGKVREHGLDGLNLHYAGITDDFARQVQEAGLKLYSWTVNDMDEAVRLRNLGVDGITTDRPGWLRKK
jgi:glycerophosphoryl diester phosphodiesterase